MQELLSVSLMVSIKHKPIIDTQKIMRKESKHNATESHQTTREEMEGKFICVNIGLKKFQKKNCRGKGRK